LSRILQDSSEIEYFRGDALISIYAIDKELGQLYADRYKRENGHLRMIAELLARGALPVGTTGLERY
jgi:hypothetical protein